MKVIIPSSPTQGSCYEDYLRLHRWSSRHCGFLPPPYSLPPSFPLKEDSYHSPQILKNEKTYDNRSTKCNRSAVIVCLWTLQISSSMRYNLSHIFWMELVWDVGTYPVLSTDRDREIQKWMTRSLTTRQMNVEANDFKGTKDSGGMWQRTTFPEDHLKVKLAGGLGILARRIFRRKRCLL